MKHSPVAMFVYNRADNTQRTLEALLANKHAEKTDLFVFSDGGKDKQSWEMVDNVRSMLHEYKERVGQTGELKSMTIVERPQNIYLERNIIEGITQVLEDHETVIVLEDDIVTSPYFLDYMNQAFYIYRDDDKVMHVSGFTNLDLPDKENHETYFTPHMSGWGWGTWARKWKNHFKHFESRDEALEGMSNADMDSMQYGGVFPCLRSLDKKPIPWDICWEIAIYKAGGLCLTPYHTLVRNIGLNNGTHFKGYRILQWYEFDREPLKHPLLLTYQRPEKEQEKEDLFRDAIRDWGIRYTLLGKKIRSIYKALKSKG